jgi:DNA-binding GntR family transcriptional regulator
MTPNGGLLATLTAPDVLRERLTIVYNWFLSSSVKDVKACLSFTIIVESGETKGSLVAFALVPVAILRIQSLQEMTSVDPVQADVQSRLYGAIVERIISGKLAAGERLVEESLAKTYRVSRTPVREVLFALEKDGLIERVRNQGARVVAFTPNDVEEVFDIRKALECFCIVNTVRTARLADLMELERRIETALASAEGRQQEEQLAATDMSLHDMIVRGSSNRRLQAYVDRVSLLLRSLQMAGYRKRHDVLEAAEEHLGIIRAVVRRDIGDAQARLAEHIENGKRHALELFFERQPVAR